MSGTNPPQNDSPSALTTESIRALLDLSPDAMIVIDERGEIVLANDLAEALFGYSGGELAGQRVEELVPERFRHVHPQDRNAYFDAPYTRPMGGALDLYALSRTGEEIPVEISLSPVESVDGMFVVAAVRNIKERKRTEEALVLQAAELAERNRELDSFAYVASHDLQEPLRKINAFGQLLESEHRGRLDDEGRSYVDFMIEAAQRMQALIGDLLAYSRLGTQGRPISDVDLSEVVGRVISDLSMQVEAANARVEVGPLPTIRADSHQMYQLLQNLISNALKFQPPGQEPRISVHAETRSVETAEAHRRGGRVCRIEVVDNGIGLEPEYAEQIFEPFKRLNSRDRFEGTGIGLAICRKIVERHGGTITATGKPGEGTTFTIDLPFNGLPGGRK